LSKINFPKVKEVEKEEKRMRVGNLTRMMTAKMKKMKMRGVMMLRMRKRS